MIELKNAIRAALDTREAATYIHMSESWLAQTRMEGNRKGRTPGPIFVRASRKILYRITDLDLWLEENRHDPGTVESA